MQSGVVLVKRDNRSSVNVQLSSRQGCERGSSMCTISKGRLLFGSACLRPVLIFFIISFGGWGTLKLTSTSFHVLSYTLVVRQLNPIPFAIQS